MELRNLFLKTIELSSLKLLIVDYLKMCHLYDPIEQGIMLEIKTKDGFYRMKDVLEVIVKGKFYQFLRLKTQ